MQTSTAGRELIKGDEGVRLTAYFDPGGVLTIGYGHTNQAPSANVYPVYEGQTITLAQAEEIFSADIAPFEQSVDAAVTRDISQNQFDALVSFTFNLGAGTLQSSDLLAKTNAGDFTGAADEFLKYVRDASGAVLEGLIARRERERALYLKELPGTTPPTTPPGTSTQLETVIDWFYQRMAEGITYSMNARLGPSSYDCSSSIYLALVAAGLLPRNSMGNTDTLFGSLEASGWSLLPVVDGFIDARRGDIFIWGIRGHSGNEGGHTGIFIDSANVISCNFGANGISEDEHDSFYANSGLRANAIYRYTASGTPYTPPPAPEPPTGPGVPTGPALVPYSGVFYPNIQVPVSGDTDPNSPALAYYGAGSAIIYDSYIFTNGYAWISYLDRAGTRRYIAVGPDDGRTDTVFGTGFLNNVPAGTGGSLGLVAYRGVFYPSFQLPVSGDTDPNSPALAYYGAGSAIIFDSYVFTNGYAWISYLDASGTRRFVAVGPDDGRTDTVYGTGFLGNVSHTETQANPGPGQLTPKQGQFIPDRRLPVSSDTTVESPEVAAYSAGSVIYYDSYIFTNGLAWISYLDGAGNRRYVAVGPDDGRADTVWGRGFFN